MHKGNDESNGAEYFWAALLAESSPLRVAEESIRYKVKALWSLLRPLEQNDDSSQLGAVSAFVERLDSQDIVDRARPLARSSLRCWRAWATARWRPRYGASVPGIVDGLLF